MDFLQKIGGRKFIMALLTVGAAMFIELKTERGLSPTMATFLGSIVAAFSVANYAVTKTHMSTKGGKSQNETEPTDLLISISDKIDQMNSPEITQQFAGLLDRLNNNLEEIQSTSGQIGKSVLQIGKQVDVLSKRVTGV